MSQNVTVIGNVTITTYAPTLRLRDDARKVITKLQGVDVDQRSRSDFSILVAYTAKVEGLEWEPPTAKASPKELAEAMQYWLDFIDPKLSDEWISAVFPTEPNP